MRLAGEIEIEAKITGRIEIVAVQGGVVTLRVEDGQSINMEAGDTLDVSLTKGWRQKDERADPRDRREIASGQKAEPVAKGYLRRRQW